MQRQPYLAQEGQNNAHCALLGLGRAINLYQPIRSEHMASGNAYQIQQSGFSMRLLFLCVFSPCGGCSTRTWLWCQLLLDILQGGLMTHQQAKGRVAYMHCGCQELNVFIGCFNLIHCLCAWMRRSDQHAASGGS